MDGSMTAKQNFTVIKLQIKSFIILAVIYAKVCNEFLQSPSPHYRARSTQLLSKKCRSHWQLCVRFDRSEILTSDLPLQR